MNLEKSQKRLNKLHKRGFHGYPLIEIQYFGETPDLATKVVINFTPEEGSDKFAENFTSSKDIRFDEAVQTTLLKIIDRVQAKSVMILSEVAKL